MPFRPIPRRKIKALEAIVPISTIKELINPQIDVEDHIANAKTNYVAADVDTAAEIATALNATNTTINTLLAELESYRILRSS